MSNDSQPFTKTVPAFDLILIKGPPDSGKTSLAHRLADKYGYLVCDTDWKTNIGDVRDYNGKPLIVTSVRVPLLRGVENYTNILEIIMQPNYTYITYPNTSLGL